MAVVYKNVVEVAQDKQKKQLAVDCAALGVQIIKRNILYPNQSSSVLVAKLVEKTKFTEYY